MKEKIKKNKLKFLIVTLMIIVLFTSIGYMKNNINKDLIQGKLPYSVISKEELEDKDLKEWLVENHKIKGIHVYDDVKNSKYVLLASGKHNIENIDITINEVVGKKDKIIINGLVDVPKEKLITNENYPYKLIKIDIKKDSRSVTLGTLNLYDTFRGIEYIEQATIGSVIISKIDEDTISLISLQGEEKVHICSLTEETKQYIINNDIDMGDIANIKINYQTNNTYPTLERITKTNSTVENILITEVLDEENLIKVKIGNIPLVFKYPKDLAEEVSRIENNRRYLVKIEDTDNLILRVTNILDI